MSVTPIDPTGTELAHGRYEAIDFTIDTDPAETVVAVRFPELGTWEVACWEGTFADQYALASSRDGSTFTLVRTGGWPAAPSAYVKEVETADGGQTWGALYEADLTALATQSITTAGAYTLDGLTWWAKGTLGSAVSGLVNGAGLRMYSPSVSVSWAQSGDVAARSLFLPFAQIDGFNASAPLMVQWRITGPVGAYSAARNAFCGVMSSGNDTSLLSADRASQVLHRITGATGDGLEQRYGASVTQGGAITPTSATWGSHQQTLVKASATRFVSYHAAWAGSFSSPDSMAGLSSDILMRPAAQANPGFIFFLQAADIGAAIDVHLTHLRISQPMVP